VDESITIYQSTVAAAIMLACLTLMVPRKYFLMPFILASCFIPTDQRFILMELDFTVLRMLVLVGVARIFVYGEYRPLKFNAVDRLLFTWAVVGAAMYVIQQNNWAAVINRAGFLFTAVGLYWLFRQKVASHEDTARVFAMLGLCAILSLPFVLVEWSTGGNPFVILGNVITAVRDEKIRCQGAFPHSIMMGLFWAIPAPMLVALARTRRNHLLYWPALASSIIIVIASASSTPILVFGVTMAVAAAFAWRRYTSAIVWSFLVLAAALHVVMNAPIWHLLARVNIIGGSTGWHRYFLIDQAVSHFREWMVMGSKTTDHWGFGLGDVTNQYILEGVRGGMITLIFFVLMMYVVMKKLLEASLSGTGRTQRGTAWALFAMMAAHAVGFIGVSYFGQISILWYLTLAAAALFADTTAVAGRQLAPASLNVGTNQCTPQYHRPPVPGTPLQYAR